MASKSNEGVNILPIPPPLEFPYPEGSGQSTGRSLATKSKNAPQARPTENTQSLTSSEPSPTRSQNRHVPVARPTALQKKYMTERPPIIPSRASLHGGIRRQSTERNISQEVNTGTWDSDSDGSTSSSSPEEGNGSSPTETRSRTNRWKNEIHKAERPRYDRFNIGNQSYQTRGRVSKRDGRLNISVKETGRPGYLAKQMGATLQNRQKLRDRAGEGDDLPLSPLREEDCDQTTALARVNTASTTASAYDQTRVPKLNIVVMVIGSRGDIQPFLRLGKILKEDHGHRVRIATHPAFRDFVENDSELEFFSVGGDPAEIMAFMVKNPGLIPKTETIWSGEIGRRRDSMFEMFQGFWRACINATDEEKSYHNRRMMQDKHPFIADVIIANPPSFAHIHCAERLGIPLHLIFTFPDSPTQAFPHPLTNIKQTNVKPNSVNFMTYGLVDTMIFQGLGDLINRFRTKTLGLEPMSTVWAPGRLFRLKVPYTYLWSPGLIPKPADWGPEIDVTGFVFLDLASTFKPPTPLIKFLDSGEAPVYIGFGSIVVDDPDKFTALIFEAVKRAGVRALVSKGWGGLGDEKNTPENIFMLENTPHDWLFPKVQAVVHHGGAGTTAIGLKCGKPTMIVPFFGDQPFWGAAVAKAGAGAKPIPYKHLTAENLAASIKELLTLEVKKNAEKIAKDIEEEGDGAANAVKSFHRSLVLRGERSLRCSILEDRIAVWQLNNSYIRLSALAAEVLIQKRRIKWSDLKLLRHEQWNDFEGPGEPFTGAGAALVHSLSKAVQGVGRIPFRMSKTIKRHERHEKKLKQRKDSEGARGSEEQPIKPQISRHMEEPEGKTGDLSHGGQHGIEKHLPEGNMGGILKNEHENYQNVSNGIIDGPTVEGSSETASVLSDLTDGMEDNVVHEIVAETGHGLAKTGGAIAEAPVDLSLAIAQGFHNAPRLYGDKTVRPVPRISGVRSGLKAAGKEFVFGVYDGWTGLIKQPYSGAKADGAKGFAKGLGRGVGGWVLKDIGAVVGPIGYTLKGVQKQLSKSQKYPDEFIEEARKIQGRKDYTELDESERMRINEAVANAWRTIANVKRREEDMRTRGVRGRIEVIRERRRWQRHGIFDSVEQAAIALRAQREGRDFDEVFKRHRRMVEKSSKPRKSTMKHSKNLAKNTAGKKETGPTGVKAEPQTNDTTVACDRTGTDVQDQATATSPPAAEALVNSALNPRPTMIGAQHNSSARDSGTGTPSETQIGWAKEVTGKVFDTPAADKDSGPQAVRRGLSSTV